MIGWKSRAVGVAVVVVSLGAIHLSPAAGAGGAHPATGVGSCTLKNWNPGSDPDDAKDLPQGERPQTYKPDDYNCTGATFAAPGVEFARFPQPKDLRIANRPTVRPVDVCREGVCDAQMRAVSQPAQAINPLGANGCNIPALLSLHETAPYFYSGLAQTLEEA